MLINGSDLTLTSSSASGAAADGHSMSLASDQRRQPRSSMFLASVLRAGTEQATVRVRNMSPTGAMIESPLIPATGTTVHLLRGALSTQAAVVWASQKRCGLRFTSEVSVQDWLAAPTNVEQARVDHIVALVKAGVMLPSADPSNGAHEPRSGELLIDDLAAVLRLMQNLEDDLASSDETLARHGLKLQNLDIAMQMLRAIASELGSNGGRDQSNEAKLHGLRVTCRQALGS